MRIGVAAAAVAVLAGCTDGSGLPGFLAGSGGSGTAETASAPAPRSVERDVEAPEVFAVTAAGLWDGRPSLGGIWVAHPAVTDPERVRITNTANGRTVEGALFRREREMPGPPVQVSAEAAAAIGLLAGQPAELKLVALRRETVEVAPKPADAAPATPEARPKARPAPAAAPAAAAPSAAPAADAIATATRAVEAAEAQAAAAAGEPVASRLARPWLQLGTFTDEANARAMADKVTADGLAARVGDGTHDGKPIWRVLVGPAANRAEMRALTRQASALGFADAYPVER